ncbi:MAG: type I phosphomannose isomerase catalytic subunit [Myxococcota bacterium]
MSGSRPEASRLRPDNFTPPARTPWGGQKIRRHYKRGLGLGEGPPVGESWEVSVEPSFPSRLESGPPLTDVIAAAPEAWLGPEEAKRRGQTPLLVKLLDAADDLSLQVHPQDGDPALAPDESGKPEAWIVLEAEAGAGLYLGFREGVARDRVEEALATGGRLDALMNFVPVTAGDRFVIDAGTPHAIGRGLTLLEPQFVAPGKRGVTYRYWDWNRRYDAAGNRDPAGTPRALHVARSLAVTCWDAPRGASFVASCRPVTTTLYEEHHVVRERLVAGPWFEVERWRGNGALDIDPSPTMWAIVCTEGMASLSFGAATALTLRRGQSAVVPAFAAQDVVAELGPGTLFAVRTPA